MQKVTEFLEKHVQWVAIALGAAFVLYMAYAYVLTPPASVEIGGEKYGPGEIDPYTAEQVATKIQSAIQGPGDITIPVPKHVQKFEETMSWKDATPGPVMGLAMTLLLSAFV